MTNKYEFVPGDEITIAPGRTFKRIRALVAIPSLDIAPDALGGYVESEKNLSRVSGNAWVSGDARVSGNAWVSGDAQVSGYARVYGDARVYGNARVYGDARVSGYASIVWFSKVGRDNGTLTVYHAKDNTILVTRGCFLGTIDQFIEKSEQVHDDQTHLEYRLLIEVAYSRLKRKPA